MATRKKQLNLVEVKELIQDLLNQSASPSADVLLAFAEAINRGPFKEPKQAKPKALKATAMKSAARNSSASIDAFVTDRSSVLPCFGIHVPQLRGIQHP